MKARDTTTEICLHCAQRVPYTQCSPPLHAYSHPVRHFAPCGLPCFWGAHNTETHGWHHRDACTRCAA